MTTRIGIIARTQNDVTVAFYYDIPVKRVAKPGYVSAFPTLPAPDLALLQSGALIEIVKSLNYSGWTLATARNDLQQKWTDFQPASVADNDRTFDAVGHTWDGSVWA